MAEPLEPPESNISSEFPFTLQTVNIFDSTMTYVDTRSDINLGDETVALFIHGNPTSSYLWRNVIPHVSPLMRCVAPDLIGMGNSSKLVNSQYRFVDHHKYLSAFIEAVVPSNPILLVMYDWGSALGLHWARMQDDVSYPDITPRLRGMVLMEFLRPFHDWEDFSEREIVREVFKSYRDPEIGHKLIVEENAFVERTLPGGVVRKLTEAELKVYRRPFLQPADRKPTYVWPNQIPIDQQPPDVYDIATKFHEWLLTSDIPKLLFWATPGTFITANKAQWYAQRLKNTNVVHLGEGSHFLPEDHPRKIGIGIRDWLIEVGLYKERLVSPA